METGNGGRLDRFSDLVGRAASWLTLLMIVVTAIVVVMRYVFDAGLIWLQESVTWMHAFVFMMGCAYTLARDEHVRVDIFYRDMAPARKGWVDAAGVVLFLWPMCLFLGYAAWDFVATSWSLKEASRESGGLPYPMLPLIKSVLVLMPVTVMLQGLALFLRSIRAIRGS
ncbi:MAG: TRAP transporter small permease subunit [Woeseiaceae bacterium]|nr:TRAP transporter small permease subunit [Woeseiaceae bacterium]